MEKDYSIHKNIYQTWLNASRELKAKGLIKEPSKDLLYAIGMLSLPSTYDNISTIAQKIFSETGTGGNFFSREPISHENEELALSAFHLHSI